MDAAAPRLALLCFAAVLWLQPATSFAADDYSLWRHSRPLYLNTTADGAHVPGNVTGFPLLVRLDTSTFDFRESSGRGRDLRFSKSGSGAHLPYQIDRWDSAAGLAEVWVRMDTVHGNSSTQSLVMHWGRDEALDSSNGGAVFDSAAGFMAVWHLGEAGTGARANSVRGGNAAVTVAYDGDESRPGLIGWADSLDGGATGDHLDLGDGYADFTGGFTYSVWVNESAAMNYAKLLDLGNGAGRDNITLFRVVRTDDLAFRIFNNTDTTPRVVAPLALSLNAWRHFAVTVSGKTARIYRDGVLIKADSMMVAISSVPRTLNFLGKSNWPNNENLRGKLDEAVLARVARGPDWIRLAFANQRPGQNLVRLARNPACQAVFQAPPDTTVPEKSVFLLKGRADCATGFSWNLVSGPGPRILDASVKDLQVFLPRMAGPAELVYRFSAAYPEGERTRDVKVTVSETIPDPVFSLPATLTWNGTDTLTIRPVITNLAAVKASPDSVINYAWTLDGPVVDTSWLPDGLRLRRSAGEGKIALRLCLDNGGAPACDTLAVTVSTIPSSLGATPPSWLQGARRGWDACGRSHGDGSGSVRRIPRFPLFRGPQDRGPR